MSPWWAVIFWLSIAGLAVGMLITIYRDHNDEGDS